MLLVRSITFDDEEIGQAMVPGPLSAAGENEEGSFLDRLRAGDEGAFGTLVDRFSGDVYAVLYRLTEDPEEAADLTQDTFLKALRAVKSFRGESALKTWLIRIAINESRNRFRWWKRRRRDSTVSIDAVFGDSDMTISDVISDESISPEDAAIERERAMTLEAAIGELPQVYREAIILCDIEGMTYEETAAALGCSMGTVKSRISRGRDELRRRLSDL